MSVYFIQRGETGPVKIGLSRNPKTRLAALQTASDQPLRLIALIDGDKQTERELHLRFADARLEGEWFSPTEEILAHARAIGGATAADDVEASMQRGLANLTAQFQNDAAGLIKHLKAELPASAFNRVIEYASEQLKADATKNLMAMVERA